MSLLDLSVLIDPTVMMIFPSFLNALVLRISIFYSTKNWLTSDKSSLVKFLPKYPVTPPSSGKLIEVYGLSIAKISYSTYG